MSHKPKTGDFVQRVAAGAVGVTKAALGIDATPGPVRSARLETCYACPEATAPGNGPRRCKRCGCFLAAKTRVAKAKCPIGKW